MDTIIAGALPPLPYRRREAPWQFHATAMNSGGFSIARHIGIHPAYSPTRIRSREACCRTLSPIPSEYARMLVSNATRTVHSL